MPRLSKLLQSLAISFRRSNKSGPPRRRIHLEQLEPRAMLASVPTIDLNPNSTLGDQFRITEFTEGDEGDAPFLFEVAVSETDGGSVVQVIFSLDSSFDDEDDVIFDNDLGTDPLNLPGDKYEDLPDPDGDGVILVTHSFDWTTLNIHGIFDDGYVLYDPGVDDIGFWVQATGSNDGGLSGEDEARLEILDAGPNDITASVTGGDSTPCGANPVEVIVTASEIFPRDTNTVFVTWFHFETSQFFTDEVLFNASESRYELTKADLAPGTYAYFFELTDADPDNPDTTLFTEENTPDPDDVFIITVEEPGAPVEPPINSVVLTSCGDLLVGGTSLADTITFTPTITPGEINVVLNGVDQGNFSPTASVQIFGYEENDAVIIDGDSTANSFAVHSDHVVLNGLSYFDNQIESRVLNARGSGDTITVSDGAATVSGGSGSDTLVAATGTANTWNILAQNAGTLGSVSFSSIEQLVGDSTADTFVLSNGEGISNGIDGGGGADTLDYSAYTTNVSVNLQSGGTSHTGGITGIENFLGGAGSDTITAANTINTWNLTGANTGDINGATTYASFENPKGGTQVDSFQFSAGDSVSGTLSGGGGADVLDYSAYGSAVSVNLAASNATAVGAFLSLSNFVGSSAADTLNGKNVNNVWTVTGAGAGTVGTTAFSSFESLQGGSANDTFRVNESVVSSGISIDGGNATANDKLDYASYVGGVNVNLATGIAPGFSSVSGIENVAGGSGNDIIRGDGGANMLAGNQGADIIHGGGGNDTINGNAGRDILIGGLGADTILGNADEDILIAGWTDYDDDGNDVAFNALLAEWTRTDINYGARTANITSAAGVGGGYRLDGNDGASQTVFNDSSVDTLTGNGGVDWFFANQDGIAGVDDDVITDKTAAELWNDTDF